LIQWATRAAFFLEQALLTEPLWRGQFLPQSYALGVCELTAGVEDGLDIRLFR
jgi:hypothetical protein